MIDETSQLIGHLLGLYDNLEDDVANCYVVSFVLLRVGCVSKTYDYDEYRRMTRQDREKMIKQVSSMTTLPLIGTVPVFTSRTGRARKSS
jgi:hypothetical protein